MLGVSGGDSTSSALIGEEEDARGRSSDLISLRQVLRHPPPVEWLMVTVKGWMTGRGGVAATRAGGSTWMTTFAEADD